ncbi:MAG TPA: phosphatase PAP2 family protein [Actinomycetes bacterium]
MAGVGRAGLGTGRPRARLLLTEVGLVVAGVLVYFGVRGLTAASPAAAVANSETVVGFERRLGLDIETAVQDLLLGWEPFVVAMNWVYIWGHWPVISAVLVWLFLTRQPAYREVRAVLLLSGAVGLLVFAGFPVAPPRLADPTVVDTVTEHSQSYRVLQPAALVNKYAAMPSLHVGWDLLMGIAIVSNARAVAVRAVGFVLPAVMVVAVVATGNHYLVDAVAGVALVLASLVVVRGLQDSRGSTPAGPTGAVPRQRSGAGSDRDDPDRVARR